MFEARHLTKRYGKTVAVDQPVPAQRPRAFTWARTAGLLVTIVLLTGFTYLGVSSSPGTASVPQGAHAGQLTMHPCTYPTENGAYRADCGTLVVPEDRADPRSRLIALPVTRVLARSSHPLAPVFRLNGGPGVTNMTFPQASRLAAQHDVVMVGYRGVDGSSVLNCPEVTAALEHSADFLAKASLRAYSQAFASCGQRLERSGVDLAGYTLEEQAADIDAARVALGYQRIDLVSESAGTRLAMIYSWMYPNSVDRSAMVSVNPPGDFLYSGAEIDQGIQRYSALCAQDPACRARTANLAASMQHTAAHMPSRWYFLPIKPGNVLVGTFLGLNDETSGGGGVLAGPNTLDSWISAAHGDPSGFWLLSEMAGLILPTSFAWGEFASIGLADAQPAQRYFSSGADRGSIVGNPVHGLLVGGRRPGPVAGQPGRGPVHQRAGLERPDAAHRRHARLPNAGPERHQGAAAAPAQRAPGHPVRARARGRLLVLRAERQHAAADHVLRHRPGRHVPLHPERGQLHHIVQADSGGQGHPRDSDRLRRPGCPVAALGGAPGTQARFRRAQDQRRGPHHRPVSARARRLLRSRPGRPGALAGAAPEQRTAPGPRPQRADRAGPLPGLGPPQLGPCHQITRSPGRNRRRPARRVARVHRDIRAVRARHHHDRGCRRRQPGPDRR